MVHYTCDLCGKELLMEEDARYVVKVEVYPVYDQMDEEEEALEEDHLTSLNENLSQEGQAAPDGGEQDDYRCFRFDLCPVCRRRYLEDPLFRKVLRRMGFSAN
jgi:hypothetical protein